jgi:hypothetical protein
MPQLGDVVNPLIVASKLDVAWILALPRVAVLCECRGETLAMLVDEVWPRLSGVISLLSQLRDPRPRGQAGVGSTQEVDSTMPAIIAPTIFPQPANVDGMLWRYLDLPKLIDLLVRSELHMTQVASLEDPFEGKFPTPVRQSLLDMWASVQLEQHTGLTPALHVDNITAWIRAVTYVNCWCKQDFESEAMWRIYGGPSGVAVRTTYRRLAEALPTDVFIAEVQYIEPELANFPLDSSLNLVMHKRHFYRHEAECRIVRWYPMLASADGRGLEDLPKGQRLALNIHEALTDVMTSPLAPAWFHDCVVAVVTRFAPDLPVVRSAMRP